MQELHNFDTTALLLHNTPTAPGQRLNHTHPRSAAYAICDEACLHPLHGFPAGLPGHSQQSGKVVPLTSPSTFNGANMNGVGSMKRSTALVIILVRRFS